MNLDQLITQYITYRKSLGEKFRTNEQCLKTFSKEIGPLAELNSISETMINNFLYCEMNVVKPGWFIKHTALLGFYQYALARGYVNNIPLPSVLPKRPPGFTPYIYSQEELKIIFDTALTYSKYNTHIRPYMIQTILILTYALGLRTHETLSITLEDIDMESSVIAIEQSKFYKSRLVPFNAQVKEVLIKYLKWRRDQKQSQSLSSPLFIGQNDQVINIDTVRGIFRKIREKAGIIRDDRSTYQPRIHDLRHSFAVHRLTDWYREKKNVQQLLPILSVYLGHRHLAHTTVYLTMTDDLLMEANARFEEYTRGTL